MQGSSVVLTGFKPATKEMQGRESSRCTKGFILKSYIISGINIFLDGFVPTENLRFREESLIFKVAESASEEEVKRMTHYEYPSMTKTLGDFQLKVRKGQFTDSEILVLLGENGTGKTTFIKLLAGQLGADDGSGEL